VARNRSGDGPRTEKTIKTYAGKEQATITLKATDATQVGINGAKIRILIETPAGLMIPYKAKIADQNGEVRTVLKNLKKGTYTIHAEAYGQNYLSGVKSKKLVVK
jgi:hypothetical protein